MQRFTPRGARSKWSQINRDTAEALMKAGRMRPAGVRAFAARTPERTGIYSYERKKLAKLSKEQEKALRANRKAAAFFDAQPPGYRWLVIDWVSSAKRPETRDRRLAQLIADCAAGRRIGLLARPGRVKGKSTGQD